MRNRFSDYPSWIIIIYFSGVIAFSILFTHPFFVMISLSVGMVYLALLNGIKKMLIQIAVMLPTVLFLGIITPLINSKGITPILYVNSRPITLESVLYGVFTGVMIISVIMWFNCFHKTLGNDKFLYAFGKRFPVTALTITMIFRFIPSFNAKLSEINSAQRMLGISTSHGKLSDRLRNGGQIFSALISISLESSIETADSMTARGFGLSRRTTYQRDRFSPKYIAMLIAIITFIVAFSVMYAKGTLSFYYFPKLADTKIGLTEIFLFCLYGLYLIIPIVIMVVDEVYWRVRMGVIN